MINRIQFWFYYIVYVIMCSLHSFLDEGITKTKRIKRYLFRRRLYNKLQALNKIHDK
jgi:hypothetical protein